MLYLPMRQSIDNLFDDAESNIDSAIQNVEDLQRAFDARGGKTRQAIRQLERAKKDLNRLERDISRGR